MKKLIIILGLVLWTISQVQAESIQIQCNGHGASSDRFVYDINFSSYIDDDGGKFNLNASGRGPDNQDDLNNHFHDVSYSSQLNKDPRGRALSIALEGPILPGNRNIDLTLDLTSANTKVDLQFSREDGEGIFAILSCTTTLPQSCGIVQRCTRTCHPMVGCERHCKNVRECSPGKFASEV